MRALLAILLLTACTQVEDELVTLDLRPAIVACLESNKMLIGVKIDKKNNVVAGLCVNFPKQKPPTEVFK